MDRPQRIFREPHEKNYTKISNSVLTDDRISWAAQGLLTYLLSRPDGWVIHRSQLMRLKAECGRRNGRGDAAVRSMLDELVDVGYIRYSQRRAADGSFAEGVYEISEGARFLKGSSVRN